MADVSLSVTYSLLKREIGRYLSLNSDDTQWSVNQIASVNDIIQEGYRQFLTPAIISPGMAHVWSFLQASDTLQIWPDVTGTVSGSPVYADLKSTVTVTAAAFYSSMVGKDFVFDTSGVGYEILSVTSTTVIVVSGNATGETADDTFTILSDGDFDLPDNFGSIDGNFRIPSSTAIPNVIHERGTGFLLEARANFITYSGTPTIFAIGVNNFDGSKGQRFKAMFHPKPNADLLLYYHFNRLYNNLDADYPYPVGGAVHGGTIRALCLAVAELSRRDESGHYQEQANRLLAVSIAQDQVAGQPRNFGYNPDLSDGPDDYFDRTVGREVLINGAPVS